MYLVLGGSRHINQLPAEVKELLTENINKNLEFLIGDAPGSDTTFSEFLCKRKIFKGKNL